MLLKETFPIKLVSPNRYQHWSKRNNTNKALRLILQAWWNRQKQVPKPPCTVSIIRVASRKLDNDNFVASAKSLRDILSDLLVPGLAPGQADNEKHGIIWVYGQERGAPKEYAVRIEIS